MTNEYNLQIINVSYALFSLAGSMHLTFLCSKQSNDDVVCVDSALAKVSPGIVCESKKFYIMWDKRRALQKRFLAKVFFQVWMKYYILTRDIEVLCIASANSVTEG